VGPASPDHVCLSALYSARRLLTRQPSITLSKMGEGKKIQKERISRECIRVRLCVLFLLCFGVKNNSQYTIVARNPGVRFAGAQRGYGPNRR